MNCLPIKLLYEQNKMHTVWLHILLQNTISFDALAFVIGIVLPIFVLLC